MMWDDETGIGTIGGILSAEECPEHIDRAERAGFEAAPIITTFGEEIRDDVRNNSRVMVDDVELASRIWARAAEHVPTFLKGRQAIGKNERFRTYRYRPGQRFDWHADGAFRRANGEVSQL